jgi:diguanylate cyclase (GGDEF)-like protein/PAS domain S-box-containing protein
MLNREEEALLRKLKRSEQRLIAAYKLVALGTWDWDLSSNEQAWSDKTYEILGVEPGEPVTRELFESLLHPDDLDYVKERLAQGLLNDDDITYGYRIVRPDGDVRYIYSHLTFEKDEKGNKLRVLGTNQDITEQKLAETALRESEERLKVAQSLVNLGCWDWDLISNKQIWSNETYRIFDVEPDVEPSRELFEDLIHPDDLASTQLATEEGIKAGIDFNYEFRIVLANGVERYISTHVGIKSDAQGNSVRLLGTNQDITQQKLIELRIIHQAYHDPLTQLPNRIMLNQELENLLQEGRFSGRRFAILWVDLDFFKEVNDNHGHLAGDVVLEEVARRLTSQVRTGDLVARVGGDEFIIMLQDANDATKLASCADKILVQFESPILFENQMLNVGTSIGGAIYPIHGDSVEALFKAADVALYYVKENGRHAYKLADDLSK